MERVWELTHTRATAQHAETPTRAWRRHTRTGRVMMMSLRGIGVISFNSSSSGGGGGGGRKGKRKKGKKPHRRPSLK